MLERVHSSVQRESLLLDLRVRHGRRGSEDDVSQQLLLLCSEHAVVPATLVGRRERHSILLTAARCTRTLVRLPSLLSAACVELCCNGELAQ